MGSHQSYMDPYYYQSMYDNGVNSFDIINKWRLFGMPQYYPPYYGSPCSYPMHMPPYSPGYYMSSHASLNRPYSYPPINYRSPYSRFF